MTESNRVSLSSIINLGIETALKEVHTCLPGVVTKFTPSTQLANVQIAIKRKLGGEVVDLPVLRDVPVRFIKVFGFSITVPVAVGDEVLLLFAERSIDVWLEQGGLKNPLDPRRHSLADAFALPMMFNQTDVITDFDNTNLQIRTTDASGKITVTPTGTIELNGNADFLISYNDFKTVFDNLVTFINTHTHPTAGTGPPSAPTTSVTADMSTAKVETVKVP